VLPLIEFANEQARDMGATLPESAVGRRIRRADAGLDPARSQRAAEFARGQADRVRFKSRNVLGIGNIAKSTVTPRQRVVADA
jgi:hypothetical protein